MLQKVIQVGNSLAVTIPKGFVDEIRLRAGQKIRVEGDPDTATFMVQPVNVSMQKENLTPEFLRWLKKFNARYKDALKELAKK